MNSVIKQFFPYIKRIYLSVFFTLLSLLCTISACTHDSTDELPSGGKETFSIAKGVNIGNWLSQSGVRGTERASAFTQKDIEKLFSYGFDHLRLPVDEEQLFQEDGKMDMETMQLVHNVIKWCQNKGMKVIFDFHILRSHNFGNANNPLWYNNEEQDNFLQMWSSIAQQLQQYSVSQVAYELMNEPVAPNDYQWNALALKLIKQIRYKEKDRIIVLGSNRWSGVAQVNQLAVPENDPNLILEFHFYEPFLLTHYQASWSDYAKLDLKEPLQYPGQLVSSNSYTSLTSEEKKIVGPYNNSYDKAYILNMWQAAIKFAKAKGLRLYCGEFGCLPNAGETNRLAWTKDVVDLCKQNGIAYSYWEYNRIFGFANEKGNIINQQLLNCLVK